MNADTAHNGKSFMYGANGVKWGPSERIGTDTPIISEDMSLVIRQGTDPDFLFTGGQVLGMVGGLIDANGSGQPDDGDCIGIVENYTVNGSATITLRY